MKQISKHNNLLVGCLILTGAFLVNVIQNALVKHISAQAPVTLTIFVQYALCFLAFLPWTLRHRQVVFRRENMLPIVTRAFFGLGYFFFMFLSLETTRLAHVSLLTNTAPLWVPIICYAIYKQSISRRVYSYILMGFVGVAFILAPEGHMTDMGSVLALVAGLFMAASLVNIKYLTQLECAQRVLFFYFAISTVAMLPFALMHWHEVSPYVAGIMLLNGLLMIVQQTLLYYGFRFGSSSKLSITTYSSVLFATLIDWLVWDKPLTTSLMLGALLIIYSAYKIVMRKETPTNTHTSACRESRIDTVRAHKPAHNAAPATNHSTANKQLTEN